MNRLIIITWIFVSAAVMTVSGQQNGYYEKHVTFPAGATDAQKIDMAARVVPTKNQLAWQQQELTAFLHFGVNTFTDHEWGDGKESPSVFNPTALDAEQMVQALKAGGIKLVILTCKHHDGFCLWPTATTEHSVKNSPYKGDVVRALRDACTKYNMKFGVYLSPWDRNAPSYGDSPKYNALFNAQLTELLTNYGTVDEVWFDGANGEGPNGKKQTYDWTMVLNTIHRLQPNAVTAICGDDIRWVGNESGKGRNSEWSVTPLAPTSNSEAEALNSALGIKATNQDLGSRELISKAKQLFWYPSETDVSIRPGWFYHASEDQKVRSLKNLVDIYFSSVGVNSSLLLNVPPDRRGRLHENDTQRLKEFGDYIRNAFSRDYLKKGQSLWLASTGAVKEFPLEKGSKVNTVMLQEHIAHGQRVEAFSVEIKSGDQWLNIGEGTTIGHKRLLRFPDLEGSRLRVTIKSTRATAEIDRVGAFYCPPIGESASADHTNLFHSSSWEIMDTAETVGKAMFDEDAESVFKSKELHPIVIDMKQASDICGFCYAPDAKESKGTVLHYRFYTSMDGQSWTEQKSSGEFSNIQNNPIPQYVQWGSTVKARYLKFEPVDVIGDAGYFTAASLSVILKQ